jgi:hypothetical protein
MYHTTVPNVHSKFIFNLFIVNIRTALQFEVLKREDVELQSHIQVVATKMYKDEQRNPVPFSALDRRLVSKIY